MAAQIIIFTSALHGHILEFIHDQLQFCDGLLIVLLHKNLMLSRTLKCYCDIDSVLHTFWSSRFRFSAYINLLDTPKKYCNKKLTTRNYWKEVG